MFKHDLFLELDMFNPAWRDRYPSIQAAATAAKVSDMYREWLTTTEGMGYTALTQGIPDTLKVNALNRAAREAWESAARKLV
jgi:hypothetical protein